MKKTGTVYAAKGKKYGSWTPTEENKEEILKTAIGPSGKLRAPTLRFGDRVVIGFHPELFDQLF